MQITGFEVQGGDEIATIVWPCDSHANLARLGGYVCAYMQNYRTNQSTSATIPAPPGGRFTGWTAEWILERPSFLDGSVLPFPNFGTATFSNISFGNLAHHTRLGWQWWYATPLPVVGVDLINGSNQLMSRAQQVQDEIMFTWFRSQ